MIQVQVRPTSWEGILGQQAVVSRIRRLLERDMLPHALLFSGPAGVGKRIVSEILAAQVLQTQPAILSAHPDYFFVSPDGASIRIAQIREIQRLAGLAPVMGSCRVCVIEQAECMEAPAANCLLKILEEPPEGLVFILITEFPHSLLSTLRSRTAAMRFVSQGGDSTPAVDSPFDLTNREYAMDFLLKIQRPGLEWMWPMLSALDEVENSQVLDIIKKWIFVLRDMGILLSGCSEIKTFNADRQEELLSLTGAWDVPRIDSCIKLAEETRRHLQRNANSRLMLESLFIRSSDLYWEGKGNADHSGSPV